MNDSVAERLAHLVDYVFVIGLFAVELVHGEKNGFVQILGRTEDILRSYLDTILRVDDDDSRIRHIEGGDGATHEVVGSRAVDHVEFLS